MATIGLYDIDLHHGTGFSLSLPLMKAYTKFSKEGHQVIMMKPYEKTGRYNKIFYFKDNPQLPVPKGLAFGEKSSLHGYGFYKNATLLPSTAELPPSFEPYDLFSNKIRNKNLYRSIRGNNLIDWREKDFTYTFAGKGFTYVNDRDFLEELDWKELFQHYDNNIEFIHSLTPADIEQTFELLSLYNGKTSIYCPTTYDRDALSELVQHTNIVFNVKDTDTALLLVFAAKILTNAPIKLPHFFKATQHEKDLSLWAEKGGQQSFKDFLGKNFNDGNYLKIKNRLLLKQKPQNMSYETFRSEYLTF